jgi:hypothetical protein
MGDAGVDVANSVVFDEAFDFEALSQATTVSRKVDIIDMADLGDWPYIMVQRVIQMHPKGEAWARQRLEEFFRDRLVAHTKFSGRLSTEGWLRMLGVALEASGIPLPENWLVCFAACDNDPACHEYMRLVPNRLRPMHYYSSVQDTLPPGNQAMIADLRPADDASAQVKGAAFELLGDYLEAQKDEMFQRNHITTSCIAHEGGVCPVAWDGGPLECCCSVGGSAPESGLPCCNFDLDVSKAVSGDWGAPVCTPFSKIGKKQRLTDMHTESLLVYSSCTGTMDMDYKCLENVGGFNIKKFTETLKDNTVVGHLHDPEDMGALATRPRLSLAALKNQRFEYVGPVEKNAIAKDFAEIFHGRPPVTTIDDVMELESERDVEKVIKRFARLRGINSMDGQRWTDLSLDALCPTFMKKTLGMYTQRFEARGDNGNTTFVADLMTDPEAREGRHGSRLPTVLRNSVMASLTKANGGRILTPSVIEFLHGWPSLDIGHSSSPSDERATRYRAYRECMPVVLSDHFEYTRCIKFIGNAQHLWSQLAWFIYQHHLHGQA